MAKRILSLDIRENGIDWVLLRTSLRSVTIEKSGQIVGRIESPDNSDTVAALKSLRDSLDSPGLTCMVSIEGHGLFARSISVPFHDRRKIHQILPLELEATLPVAVDELLMDFQLAGNGGIQKALAVAMPRAEIDRHLQLLRKAGLDPVLITFSGLPAATLLATGPHGEGTSLLIDGDEDHSTLFVVRNRQIHFVRSWTPSTTEGDPVTRLKQAIDQTLAATTLVLPATDPLRAIYLTPRSARHYAPERIAAALDLEVEVFDLHRSAHISPAGELSGSHGQGALALGLYESIAEKGLNLFRSTFPLKRFLQQHRTRIVRAGVLATLLLSIFLTDVFLDIRRNEARANHLQAEVEIILKQAFPETRNIVNPLQQMIVKLREARGDEGASTLGTQVAKIDILNTISQLLPPELDIHVSQLVAGTERVQISGTTGTFETVNEAKGHLEKSDILGTITIVSANMDQRAGRVRFKLSTDLRHRP